MDLQRIGERGSERPVATVDETSYDLTSLTADIDPTFFASDGVARVTEALEAGSLPETSIAGQRVGAPLARPGAVVCIGMNYAAHAAETGSEPPTEPIVFYKHPNTIVGPHDDILLPRGCTAVDWEVELGVVIGRRARYLDSPADALSYVAGYVLSNDVSERDLQIKYSGGQWSKGKSCETFNPLGPWIRVADQVNPGGLSLSSAVNGEPRQDSTTADLVFGVADLIYRMSQFMVLEPGDLLNTGTPQGVGLSGNFPYLVAGDVVSTTIDGLGAMSNTCSPA